MKSGNLIVFDMDGVLIDVSSSYREAVRKTARRFLAGAKNSEQLPDPLFPLDDLARLKQSGGLNNDWELTARTLNLLFCYIEADTQRHIAKSTSYEKDIKTHNVEGLAKFLKESESPLAYLHRKYGVKGSLFVEGFFRGNVKTGNIIKRMFQEIYLGSSLFRSTYGVAPKYCKEDGLINNEKLFCDEVLLKNLAESHILAIATGRPKMEALQPLEKFRIQRYFKEIVTLDDILREEKKILVKRKKKISLSKPNPFMLDYVAEKIGGSFQALFYIGDMPDDMQAAKASKKGYRAIGVVYSSPDSQDSSNTLLAAGADDIIYSLAVLPKIIG
jgi:phosphoglycolate phosphatase-like HAD superfamily hydrolase